VREAGRPDLALVGLVAAVRDEVYAKFALGRFDRGIDLARRNVKAFSVELEMMDQRPPFCILGKRRQLPAASGILRHRFIF